MKLYLKLVLLILAKTIIRVKRIFYSLKSTVALITLGFSREYYKSAFEFYSKKYADYPGDIAALSFKGIAAAGLNDRINAIEWGQNAVNLSRNNAPDKADRMVDLAQIYVMVKEYSKALDLLEELLSGPSSLSTGKLKLDPVWTPLHEIPRFKELILKYPITR